MHTLTENGNLITNKKENPRVDLSCSFLKVFYGGEFMTCPLCGGEHELRVEWSVRQEGNYTLGIKRIGRTDCTQRTYELYGEYEKENEKKSGDVQKPFVVLSGEQYNILFLRIPYSGIPRPILAMIKKAS